jgi:UDP-3-O-[3-hydroxymyristoyl] N-acetylglucosamine deacetylase
VTGTRQTTIRDAICCAGVGLHSGSTTCMTLQPAAANTGIVFVRSDLGGAAVAARYDLVADTMLGTTLEAEDGTAASSVEHLMAALWGCGIDNLVIELDQPEVPALDGSAEPFVFLLECAGRRVLAAPRHAIRVLRPVSVEDGDRRIALIPDDELSVRFEIAFDNPVVGRQTLDLACVDGAFKAELARARTFGFLAEVAAMREAGLAGGGSLENAVVVDDKGVLNVGGLRFPDEFVRHKVLDCLGDLYLAGAPLVCRVEAACSGHGLNNAVLRALFADGANWCLDTVPAWREGAVAALA